VIERDGERESEGEREKGRKAMASVFNRISESGDEKSEKKLFKKII